MAKSSRDSTATEPRRINHQDDGAGLYAVAADARREAGAGIEAVRGAAADIGEKMPDLIRTARSGAEDSVRTIQGWPEPTQRVVAIFSVGLGVGLLVAGSARLLVAGALLPALAVAAATLGRETGGARRAL